MEPLIRLENVTMTRNGKQPVLNGCSFSLLPGDRIGLIGANGSGKSSLLWLMVGLLAPQSGTISIFGRIRQSEHDFQQIRGDVGLLFQDSNDQLFCSTVMEEIAFGPLNQGKTVAEARQIVHDMLERFGMSSFAHRVTHHLSGGEKRLVALASVLAMSPQVLLLDEPDSDLDENALKTVADILGYDSSRAMIIASHNHDFLNSICNRTFSLNNGRISKVKANG